MEIERSQLGEAPPPVSLEDHVLQMARGGPGAVYRAAQRQAAYGEVPKLRKEFLTLRNTCCMT